MQDAPHPEPPVFALTSPKPTCGRGKCPRGWSRPRHVSQLPWQSRRRQSAPCRHLHLRRTRFQSPSRKRGPGKGASAGEPSASRRPSRTVVVPAVNAHLHRNWRSGVNEGAPRKPSPCAGVRQEGHRGEMGGEHAGSHRWKDPRRVPGDFFRLNQEDTELRLIIAVKIIRLGDRNTRGTVSLTGGGLESRACDGLWLGWGGV